MAHAHDHGSQSYTRAFAIGVALNLAYVAVELTYGLIAGSLALISDAGHNLSDVLGLLLAWGATWLVRRRPSPRRSYGFRRSSVLAALFNALFLLVAVGVIAWEAIQRLANPEPVAGVTVMVVAAVGIAVNGTTAWLFMSGQKGDVNIRGAFLHMAADAVVSLGVVLSGFVILLTGWDWLDPVTSLVIVVVIVFGTWGLLRESVDLALDAVPEGIDPAEVQAYLAAVDGVREVHDLHIWGMSTTETALTAHLVIPGADGRESDGLLRRVCEELHERFEIEHATIQIEHGDPAHPCPLAPARVV
jgi:cobalt-zinc-cadmium efflux system protein